VELLSQKWSDFSDVDKNKKISTELVETNLRKFINFSCFFDIYIVKLRKKCYNGYKLFTSKGWTNMNYKRLVKELREKLIITQEELAQLLGVSFASINRWETGKHEPTIKIRRKIVQLCKENNIKVED